MEDEIEPNVALLNHYSPLVKPHANSTEQFYSYRFFLKNRWFHSGKSKIDKAKAQLLQSSPHPRITAFNQGSVHFPYEDREKVLERIAWDVMAETVMYWNQVAYDVPGEGMRLAVDFDSDTRVLKNDEINRMAHILWKTLNEYYLDFATNPIDIFVAKCGPRVKKLALSVGVHFVAHVKVSIPEAKQIIYGFNLRLKLDQSVNLEGLTVDDSIYKEGAGQCSMRMIYCNKVENCPMCNNETARRQCCTFCDKMGETISKSTYTPMSCLDPKLGLVASKEYFESKHDDWLNVVKNYSIWPEVGDDTHQYAKPGTDPTVPPKDKKSKRYGPDDKNQRVVKRTKPLPNDQYELLTEYLHNLVFKEKAWWTGIEITKVELSPNEKHAFINVTGLGSSMCPYAMRDHGENRIWFLLDYKGNLTVRCHSDKGCKEKEKITFAVPGNVYQKIFGLSTVPPFTQFKEAKEFDFDGFHRRADTGSYRPIDTAVMNREKKLERLSQGYQVPLQK